MTRSLKTREAKGLANSSESTDLSDRPNLYISSFVPLERLVLKTILPVSILLFSMATVDMNCVIFYNPKHLPSLQPSISPPGDAESTRNVQDSDSLDDSSIS